MIILVCVGKTEEDGSVEFAIVAVSFTVSFVVDTEDVRDDDDDDVDGEDVDGDCSFLPDSEVTGGVATGGEISINVVL